MNPQIRSKVQKRHLLISQMLRSKPESSQREKEAQVRDGNQDFLRGQEEFAGQSKVAHVASGFQFLTIGQAFLSGRQVEHQIQLPSHQLMLEKSQDGDDGGFLGHVEQLVEARGVLTLEVILRFRDEHGIFGDMAGIAVMASMSDLPRKVRNQK